MRRLRYAVRVLLVLIYATPFVAFAVVLWDAVWRIGLMLLAGTVFLGIFWTTWEWAWKKEAPRV